MKLKFAGEIVIRDAYSTVFAPFDRNRKNIVIMHHLDLPEDKKQMFFNVFKRRFYQKARTADKIVVVSEFWREILEKEGCSNVEIIYNSFDLGSFNFNNKEIQDLRLKLSIPQGKPIIYLGVARPEKGYAESYEQLRGIDAIFITTGTGRIDLPIIHKYLAYGDYLKMLKLSTLAVLMSKFKEGWCRNAHEAMLCGTPVIGSGKGGMKELLTKGGQIICDDFSNLQLIVSEFLRDEQRRAVLSRSGQKYASQFSLEYFKEKWLKLIESIIQNDD